MTDETSTRSKEGGESRELNEEESVRGLRTGDDSTLASRVVQLGEWDVRGSAVFFNMIYFELCFDILHKDSHGILLL